MEPSFGESTLRLVYGLLGKWGSRALAYVLITIGAIWIAEPLLDKLESLVPRVGGTDIKWIVEPDFLVTILLMAVLLIVVCGIPAIFFGVLSRIAGIAIYRREVGETKTDIQLIKEHLGIDQLPKVSSDLGEDFWQ